MKFIAGKIFILAAMLFAAILLSVGNCEAQIVNRAPQPSTEYDLNELYKGIKKDCPSHSLSCFEPEFHKMTEEYGPRVAIEVFRRLRDNGEVKEKTDGHHVVHHIGHHTAIGFGPTPEALALC